MGKNQKEGLFNTQVLLMKGRYFNCFKFPQFWIKNHNC